jgi:hypothetical protein
MLVLGLMVVGIGTFPPPAHAARPVYGDFSMMTIRSTGQFWADGRVAGKWAWSPQPGGESRISWGDPAAWPPDSAERFIRDGDWVLLDGWADNGTYYTLRVHDERIGNAHCEDLQALPSAGGRQHYVRWTIPAEAYCLKAWGTITEQSSGRTLSFSHTQIWSPPAGCSNAYYGGQTCVKQWESWWDNHGSPGAPIVRKLERDQYIARGIGMAFKIEQFYPSAWRADLRYHGRGVGGVQA